MRTQGLFFCSCSLFQFGLRERQTESFSRSASSGSFTRELHAPAASRDFYGCQLHELSAPSGQKAALHFTRNQACYLERPLKKDILLQAALHSLVTAFLCGIQNDLYHILWTSFCRLLCFVGIEMLSLTNLFSKTTKTELFGETIVHQINSRAQETTVHNKLAMLTGVYVRETARARKTNFKL